MRHLGIVVATPAEARSLTRQPVPFGRQVSFRDGVSIYLSGIGPHRSRLAAESLLKERASALLSWGSAGGLVPDLRPGIIILPKTVVAANQTKYLVDPKWHEDLWNRLAGHLDLDSRPLAESAQILVDSRAKEALFRQTGATAVDMESASVASAAREAGIPFLAVRAIADPVGQAIPRGVQFAFDSLGRLNPFRVLSGLTKRPGEILGVVRLGLSFRAAHASLAAARRLTGGTFCLP